VGRNYPSTMLRMVPLPIDRWGGTFTKQRQKSAPWGGALEFSLG